MSWFVLWVGFSENKVHESNAFRQSLMPECADKDILNKTIKGEINMNKCFVLWIISRTFLVSWSWLSSWMGVFLLWKSAVVVHIKHWNHWYGPSKMVRLSSQVSSSGFPPSIESKGQSFIPASWYVTNSAAKLHTGLKLKIWSTNACHGHHAWSNCVLCRFRHCGCCSIGLRFR